MYDTHITIIGNVLTAPEWRRTAQSNTLVANFKVASTARRLNRDSGRWVDGNSLRVRVNCWRKLAEGVASSVMVGDPVVVAGRLYTRDWTDEAGNHRTLYELEAVTVGHDLSRGRGRFLRNRPTMAISAVEDAEAENRVHGEPTERIPLDQAPASPADRPVDEDFESGGFDPSPAGRYATGRPDFEDLAPVPFGDRPGLTADGDDRLDPADDGEDSDDSDDDELTGLRLMGVELAPLPDGAGPSGDITRAGEADPSAEDGHDGPGPSGAEPADPELPGAGSGGAGSGGPTPGRRGRRGGGRVPVSA
ncbi:single-stranded DNA-binding protein [Micromonospora sp. DT233]|uniref:single-stranded DNA-binding protein n=1 Tax=Micromonospora sp. DT233 TaxID=3393432 RepID=UPI003CF6CD01